jgi:hypothetical protein
MATHLLLAFGKSAAGTTLAIIFLIGFIGFGLATLIGGRLRA